MNASIVLYDPIFAAWQTGDHSGARFVSKEFFWGDSVQVSVALTMLQGFGGGPTWFSEHNPRYQPDLTCSTCPHWGVSKYGTNYCAHPFYIDTVGCPQSNGSGHHRKNKAWANNNCPMLGKRDWRNRRRFRVEVKAERLLEYYGGDLDKVPRWVYNGFWAGLRIRSRMWGRPGDEPFHPSRLPASDYQPS